MKPDLFPALAALVLTAACTAPTMAERLEGKTGEARKEELYLACKQHARHTIAGGHSTAYGWHKWRMLDLCEAMNAKDVTASEKVTLARQCATEIRGGLVQGNEVNERHFGEIKEICEEMTGQNVAF